jgi:hypothetical protein
VREGAGGRGSVSVTTNGGARSGVETEDMKRRGMIWSAVVALVRSVQSEVVGARLAVARHDDVLADSALAPALCLAYGAPPIELEGGHNRCPRGEGTASDREGRAPLESGRGGRRRCSRGESSVGGQEVMRVRFGADERVGVVGNDADQGG